MCLFSVAPTLPQEEPLIYDIGPSGSFWLSWRPADFPMYMSESSPVTYTIYVQEPPSTTWRPLVRRIPHPFYQVTSLRNDKDYSFRIQAENEFGLSRPTLPVKMLGVKSRICFKVFICIVLNLIICKSIFSLYLQEKKCITFLFNVIVHVRLEGTS